MLFIRKNNSACYCMHVCDMFYIYLQECSIFISGDGITEELVRKMFGKFGPIHVATVDAVKG